MVQITKIVYPDGTEEYIKHYGMYAHSSGGFGFYLEESDEKKVIPYIFVSGTQVRKIVPIGAA